MGAPRNLGEKTRVRVSSVTNASQFCRRLVAPQRHVHPEPGPKRSPIERVTDPSVLPDTDFRRDREQSTEEGKCHKDRALFCVWRSQLPQDGVHAWVASTRKCSWTAEAQQPIGALSCADPDEGMESVMEKSDKKGRHNPRSAPERQNWRKSLGCGQQFPGECVK